MCSEHAVKLQRQMPGLHAQAHARVHLIGRAIVLALAGRKLLEQPVQHVLLVLQRARGRGGAHTGEKYGHGLWAQVRVRV